MALAAVLSLGNPVAAQSNPTPTLTVPTVLNAGTSASISYSNPALANQTIVIDVDDGMRTNTQTTQIEITLDASGKGTVSWTVPEWFGANFNAPGCSEVHAPIL
ncbi:MAG: hypothetical protein KAI24_26620 [Planctomycetes bacterium]|nr:hypothetical protein [Planctomycetota bacterium]